MDYFEINGPCKLHGKVKISGAKNSSLPIIASTLLSKNGIKITNVPNVKDINTLLDLMEDIGSTFTMNKNQVYINNENINSYKADYNIVKKLRASILLLGPLLARFNKCDISFPGGCAIGTRPVDLHLQALESMGATFKIKNGYIYGAAPNGLFGSEFEFSKKTVGGTENALMAASLAKGKTTLKNVALEPEIEQLCNFLVEGGIEINGIGTNTLEVNGSGGKLLNFKSCEIIPDRIEAGTFLCAAGITNSSITLENINANHIQSVINKLKEVGFTFSFGENSLTINKAKKLSGCNIETLEHPGFPTDLQAQFMALCLNCEGESNVKENLFENRFMHISELNRMGADITVNGNVAHIIGPKNLTGANVMASDLRASSALIIGALIAKGTTNVDRIYHLDRGYENFEEKLSKLGVKISRLRK